MMSGAAGVRAGRVLYVQYTNPAAYPPLEHSAHLFGDAGLDVRIIGTSIPGGILEIKPHPRIQIDLRVFDGRGWRQKLHYLSFLAWACAQAARWRPTWVYASDPLACPIALVLCALTGARAIYHEHDSPNWPEPRERQSAFQRAVLRARGALARRADVCIVPNHERARVFTQSTLAREPLTIWNCPMREDVAPARVPAEAGRLRVIYHGSIVPSRLPIAVIDALASLPPQVSLQFAGYETAGHPGYAQALVQHARALGLADRVAYAGIIPRRIDLMRQCATCDVGLALLPAASSDLNERTMAGASNKPFDYLASGVPVLVADLPDWRHTFVDTGFGLACDAASAESIAAALRWFLNHPAERSAMGEQGRLKILREWNYDMLFAPVLREVAGTAFVSAALRIRGEADLQVRPR